MASKPSITREEILDIAYDRAQNDGVASLGIRTIASECGVAVGTIYNYFPDKASLVTEVVGRFWRQAIERAGIQFAPDPSFSMDEDPDGEGVVDHCRRLAQSLTGSLRSFRAGWLREISTLDARTRERTHAAEGACFRSIRDGIQRSIEQDGAISPAARDSFDSAELADFIWTGLFDAIKRGDDSAETLLKLLELALYR